MGPSAIGQLIRGGGERDMRLQRAHIAVSV